MPVLSPAGHVLPVLDYSHPGVDRKMFERNTAYSLHTPYSIYFRMVVFLVKAGKSCHRKPPRVKVEGSKLKPEQQVVVSVDWGVLCGHPQNKSPTLSQINMEAHTAPYIEDSNLIKGLSPLPC